MTHGSDSEPAWDHPDVFPIVAEIINNLCQGTDQYVTVREIAPRLLVHPEARARIDEASEQLGSSRERIATNMVAWFGQRISVENTHWKDKFKREMIGRRWGYRPNEELTCQSLAKKSG